MAATVLVESPEDDLAECARIANGEHEHVLAGLEQVLHNCAPRAMVAGDALIRAREIINSRPDLTWARWCSENLNYSLDTVQHYMRLAFYRPKVEEWMRASGDRSLTSAKLMLRGLPPLWSLETAPERKKEAQRLIKGGMSLRDVAALFGVHHSTVKHWVDRDAARARNEATFARRKEAEKAKRALKEKERRAMAARIGGDPSETYSLIRRASQHAHQAMVAASTSDERACWRTALAQLGKAEASVSAALRAHEATS